jgi:hypothetical protein
MGRWLRLASIVVLAIAIWGGVNRAEGCDCAVAHDPARRPRKRPSSSSDVSSACRARSFCDFAPPPDEVWFNGVIVDGDGRPIDAGVWLDDIDLQQGASYGPADYMGRFRVKAWKGHRYTLTSMQCSPSSKGQAAPMMLRGDADSATPLRIVLSEPCPVK